MTIRVLVLDDDDQVLAGIEIERQGTLPDALKADYSVQTTVVHPNGDEAGHQTKVEQFPRLTYNVLGLVREALESLEERNMESSEIVIPGTVRHGGVYRGPGQTNRLLDALGPVVLDARSRKIVQKLIGPGEQGA